MIHFFPRHKLSSEELSLIPEAFFCLCTARFKVTFLPARSWLAGSGMAQGAGRRAQGEEDEGATGRWGDGATGRGGEGTKGRWGEGARRKGNYYGFEPAPKKQHPATSTQQLETLNLEPGTLNNRLETIKLVANVTNGLALRTPWKSTCLVKALAASKMLSKRHIPHSIHFGMKKNDSGNYEAHAWVSAGGRVLIGGENVEEYKEVGRFEG